MVYLGGGGHGEVELGREVEVKVEVLLGINARGIGETGRRRDHEEREGLGPRGRQGLFPAIHDLVGIDALDSIEELRILAG